MSRTLATNSGSLDSFHESCLCGANPNARHTRDTIDCDSPRCSAIDRVDQCVASGGALSNVAVINASICSPPTTRGSTRSRFVEQSVAPLLGEPVAPLTDRVAIQLQPVGEFDIGSTIGGRQHDPGPQSQAGSTLAPPNPALQLGAFILGQHNLRSMWRRHHP